MNKKHELLLTCVRSFVDFEVFGSGEDFAAAWEGARERLLTGVDANVVHQLVLGLEWLAVAGAVLPEARVVGLLGAPDVFHRQVRDDLVHRREELPAWFARLGRILVYPQTRVFLFDGRAHVAEKRTRAVWVHPHVLHAVRPVRVVIVL